MLRLTPRDYAQLTDRERLDPSIQRLMEQSAARLRAQKNRIRRIRRAIDKEEQINEYPEELWDL